MTRTADAKQEFEALYADYAACLDEDRIEQWPEFFSAECLYAIIPRENFERGLPLATMRCESRAMLVDRVRALRAAAVFSPRLVRHLVSGVRVLAEESGEYRVQASYAVFESRLGEATRIFNVGRYLDRIVRDGDVYRFREKLCIFDGSIVPSSLVIPI